MPGKPVVLINVLKTESKKQEALIALLKNNVDTVVPTLDGWKKWRFGLGAVEGRPAMLVFDSDGPMERPSHFVLIDWRSDRIIAIRDFLFTPCAPEAVDWCG